MIIELTIAEGDILPNIVFSARQRLSGYLWQDWPIIFVDLILDNFRSLTCFPVTFLCTGIIILIILRT